MKIKIKKYKFEKVEVSNIDFTLPTETQYFFQTHYRRAIRIKPIYTTHLQKKGEEEKLVSFEITFLYQSFEFNIQKHFINVQSIEEAYYNKDSKLHSFVIDWVDNDLLPRGKKDFENELEYMIKELQ